MKYTLKKRIKANVIKENDKYRGSGSWLNNALPFNHSRRLNEDIKEKLDIILNLCGISKRKENYLNLEVLIATIVLPPYNRSTKKGAVHTVAKFV